jgi:hypothetical protein
MLATGKRLLSGVKPAASFTTTVTVAGEQRGLKDALFGIGPTGRAPMQVCTDRHAPEVPMGISFLVARFASYNCPPSVTCASAAYDVSELHSNALLQPPPELDDELLELDELEDELLDDELELLLPVLVVTRYEVITSLKLRATKSGSSAVSVTKVPVRPASANISTL